MARGKKTSFNIGDDVALTSMYEENFKDQLEQYKNELEKQKKEQEMKFNQYESDFNDILIEDYADLGKSFLEAVKLQGYPSLKDAMSVEANRIALNKKKDFRVLLTENKEIYNKVLFFIAHDELVSEAIASYVTELMLSNKEDKGEVASVADIGEKL